MSFNKESIKTVTKVITNTLVCSVFLIVGVIASLSLRGDLQLPFSFNTIIGSILLAFVLGTMFTLVYKSQQKGDK
jgi:hypothetical protein